MKTLMNGMADRALFKGLHHDPQILHLFSLGILKNDVHSVKIWENQHLKERIQSEFESTSGRFETKFISQCLKDAMFG